MRSMPPRARPIPAEGREEALRREMVTRFVAPRGVDDPRVLGLAEMMNFPGVVAGDEGELAKLREGPQ